VDSMYNIKIGDGVSDYITLGRELRALQRTMSRSTMPGHEIAPAERDALLRGASFKQAASPAASTPPPLPRASKKRTAASAPAPQLPPLFGPADSPEEEQQQHKPDDAEENVGTDNDDGGDGDAKAAAAAPSPHFSPAKLVSFAGAAVFAEDSDSAESSTEEFERKLEEINTRRISIDSASTGDFFIDDDEEEEDADEEDAFFDTAIDQERRRNHRRHRRLHRDASMCRQKMTEKDRASLSARRWLRGDEPLLSADDIAAIDLLREDAERGLASKRLSQFRNSDGLLAPSLLFMKIKEDYRGGGGASERNSSGDGDGGVNLVAASVRHQHQQQQRSDLDKFWDFRDRLLRAKVDAALRKDLLSNLRGC
jgi:hypothetical protein